MPGMSSQGLKGLLVASESVFHLSVALECPPSTGCWKSFCSFDMGNVGKQLDKPFTSCKISLSLDLA